MRHILIKLTQEISSEWRINTVLLPMLLGSGRHSQKRFPCGRRPSFICAEGCMQGNADGSTNDNRNVTTTTFDDRNRKRKDVVSQWTSRACHPIRDIRGSVNVVKNEKLRKGGTITHSNDVVWLWPGMLEFLGSNISWRMRNSEQTREQKRIKKRTSRSHQFWRNFE